MEDVREESRYEIGKLFGEDAFYDTLGEVVSAFRRQMGSEAD
jgi:hypothetical protein